MWTNTFRLLAVRHAGARQAGLADARAGRRMQPIAYPKPDGKLTFDKLSSVFLSNTNHEEDQPVHLKVADMALQKTSEHDVYAGPSSRYCPAGVYEWVEEAGGRASRSTRRTASTARPAISRTRTRTSPGCRPKAAADPTTRRCDLRTPAIMSAALITPYLAMQAVGAADPCRGRSNAALSRGWLRSVVNTQDNKCQSSPDPGLRAFLDFAFAKTLAETRREC